MTTYRLLNNVHAYHEAFVDFRAMRRQFDNVKVWFPQKNETLLDKLRAEWVPVGVKFESDSKNNRIPEISVWNHSCLVLSEKAMRVLDPILNGVGETLELDGGFTLLNCLDSVGGDAVDQSKSRFDLETEDSIHIPKELTLLPEKIEGKALFKPAFAHNSFLICQDEFKRLAERNELGGVIFEENLAKMFL